MPCLTGNRYEVTLPFLGLALATCLLEVDILSRVWTLSYLTLTHCHSLEVVLTCLKHLKAIPGTKNIMSTCSRTPNRSPLERDGFFDDARAVSQAVDLSRNTDCRDPNLRKNFCRLRTVLMAEWLACSSVCIYRIHSQPTDSRNEEYLDETGSLKTPGPSPAPWVRHYSWCNTEQHDAIFRKNFCHLEAVLMARLEAFAGFIWAFLALFWPTSRLGINPFAFSSVGNIFDASANTTQWKQKSTYITHARRDAVSSWAGRRQFKLSVRVDEMTPIPCIMIIPNIGEPRDELASSQAGIQDNVAAVQRRKIKRRISMSGRGPFQIAHESLCEKRDRIVVIIYTGLPIYHSEEHAKAMSNDQTKRTDTIANLVVGRLMIEH
ncbi:hypothetical protein BKA70DRAFT_1231403 [Coprinopsis sp. MPI-PUGE-AT-0042]|nr:hypothetical protein BKA70DRAFT_1231403 [Coprinopsis sp. MPI-PUGE-AT-0042]